MLALESAHHLGGAFVVPQRRGLSGRASGLVDEHRSMHLPACAHRRDARSRSFDRGEHVANRGGDARPPIERPLLRPAELRHDLFVLAGGNLQDCAGFINQRSPHAAGANVDGEGEIAAHGKPPGGKSQRLSDPALNWMSMATTIIRPI